MFTRQKAAKAAKSEPAHEPEHADVNLPESDPAETSGVPPVVEPPPPPSIRSVSSRTRTSITRTDRSVIAVKDAELEAVKMLEEVEKEVIRKETELEQARKEAELRQRTIKKQLELKVAKIVAASEKHSHSSRSSRSSLASVDLWLQKNAELDMTQRTQVTQPSDIKLLAKEIKKLSPSSSEPLPDFNGNPDAWIAFKAAFLESSPRHSDAQNVARLNRCLKGEAHEAVAASLHTMVSPSQILETLELRFGRPELILQREIRSIQDMPKLTDSTEYLCKFAAKIQNCIATIQSLDREQLLHDNSLIQSIKSKMSILKTRYLCYIERENRSSEPELVKLSKFLNYEAKLSTKFWSLDVTNINKSNLTPVKSKTYFSELTSDFCDCDQKVFAVGGNEVKSPDLHKFEWNTCPYCGSKTHRTVQECEKFKAITTDERWNWAKENKFCFKCLKSKHRREYCRAPRCSANGCKMPHNRMLHANNNPTCSNKQTACTCMINSGKSEPEPEPGPEPSSSYSIGTSTCGKEKANINSGSLLKILQVILIGPHGSKKTYALLDGGSTLTLIQRNVASELGLSGPTEPLTLAGVNAVSKEPESQRVNFSITGSMRDAEVCEVLNARTVNRLPLSSQTISDLDKYEHLKDLPLKDICFVGAKPEILIGQDNWPLLMTSAVRRGRRDEPVASLTPLGWVIHGSAAFAPKMVNFVGHTDSQMHDMIEDYFKIDSLGISAKKRIQPDDKRALHILESTARRIEDGQRWEVGLLWRDEETKMPDSFENARNRLRGVERKMDQDRSYGEKYVHNMNIFLNSGYAERSKPTNSPKKFFLPHFGVTNVNKPGKLRIVFDAANKVNGTSLNDKLLTGPDLLLSLLDILFKFREGAIALNSDIKEMFLQIRIKPEDRPAQRFLWRALDRNSEMMEHEMKSVMFGAVCSPATAIYIVNRNAEEFSDEFPEAVRAIKTRFYMDDYLHSLGSEEEAIKMMSEVSDICQKGGFQLTQWMSNSKKVLEAVPVEKRGTGGVDLNLNAIVKTLGLRWNPSDDTLGFNLNCAKVPKDILEGEKTPTKRELLSVVMSIFDPLGLIAPITIQGRVLLQEIWKSGVDWDQKLPPNQEQEWLTWLGKLKESWSCKISRWYGIRITETTSINEDLELHIFCDASQKAYAAVAYWRHKRADGSYTSSLICSKSRVAPKASTTIPRLELQAALLSARLGDTITKGHDKLKPIRRYFWSDSTTVIYWIRKDPRNFKTFVSHRLGEIAELTKAEEWRWVSTQNNVADDATREINTLPLSHRWFMGPEFLKYPEEKWPNDDLIPPLTPLENQSLELKVVQSVNVISGTPSEICDWSLILPSVTRFSSWMRLIRSTAYVIFFIEKLRRKCTGCHLEVRHLEQAEILWIKFSQSETYSKELQCLHANQPLTEKITKLRKLSPILDGEGIIRLKGRIDAVTEVTGNVKRPVILDGRHPYTRLLVHYFHQKYNHSSTETIVNILREKYWIVKLRPTVRTIERNCQKCKILKAKPLVQPTGNLPEARLAHHRRPFDQCGWDYFGPMSVSVGRRNEKRYGVLFTCLTTRAVHLELAASLTTDSAIMALRRMMARRGCPSVLYSDNGTNLRGTEVELRKAIKDLDQNNIRDFLVTRRIEWKFIPPASPQMGGAWERLVRSVKQALKATLREKAPREEVLLTLLSEAELIINSRPLTHVSVNPDDPEALTPNHFLLGSESGVPQPGSFEEGDMSRRSQWRKSQFLADVFWKRWILEYLPTLLPRDSLGEREDLKIGDIVIIADGTLPRNVWPRGVIQRVYPGQDGRVRVADVHTRGGVLKRPSTKLIRLPVSCGGEE